MNISSRNVNHLNGTLNNKNLIIVKKTFKSLNQFTTFFYQNVVKFY